MENKVKILKSIDIWFLTKYSAKKLWYFSQKQLKIIWVSAATFLYAFSYS